MKDKTILIADDEADIRKLLLSVFTRAGYTQLLTASSGNEALKIWEEKNPDMLILDVMLPGKDGFEVLKQIRKKSRIPVLMLTARGESEDKIAGFENGADDYLVKPFLTQELLLRVQAILNRSYPDKERVICLGETKIHLDRSEAVCGDKISALTATELMLLNKLLDNEGRIVTTGALCEVICGKSWYGYESTLAVHIRHLREKIEVNPSKPSLLLTVKGIGYKLVVKGGAQ